MFKNVFAHFPSIGNPTYFLSKTESNLYSNLNVFIPKGQLPTNFPVIFRNPLMRHPYLLFHFCLSATTPPLRNSILSDLLYQHIFKHKLEQLPNQTMDTPFTHIHEATSFHRLSTPYFAHEPNKIDDCVINNP
jgi:hypothetical protein